MRKLLNLPIILVLAFAAQVSYAQAPKGQEDYNRALRYLKGEGVKQSDKDAFQSLEKAANQGHAEAQAKLGDIYREGWSRVRQNYAQAVKYYGLAAEQGHAGARYELSKFYDGVYSLYFDFKLDREAAAKLYRLAADQGHAEAQRRMGYAYEIGRGVKQDHEEAVKWNRLAADQGHAEAQRWLGRAYEIGRGVKQDRAEAVRWYRLAADQGHADAQKSLLEIEQKVAAERAEAEKVAAEWAAISGGPGVYWLELGLREQRLTQQGERNERGQLVAPRSVKVRTIWKDFTPYSLSSYYDADGNIVRWDETSGVNSLFVSGDDVYMTGYTKGESYNRATLWKNGAAQQLDNVASNATAVFVSGSDVYVAGTRGTDEAQRPALWKNGVAHALGEAGRDSWVPRGVLVNPAKGDLTVVGYKGYTISSGGVPILWRGVLSDTIRKTEETALDERASLFVSDSDIYVVRGGGEGGGFEFKGANEAKFRSFDIGREMGAGYYVSGGGLRVAGEARGDLYTVTSGGKLFKNGVEQKLETFENPESLQRIPTSAWSVFVSGNDVYVTGSRAAYRAGGVDYPRVNLLWKNGVAQVMPDIPGGVSFFNFVAAPPPKNGSYRVR